MIDYKARNKKMWETKRRNGTDKPSEETKLKMSLSSQREDVKKKRYSNERNKKISKTLAGVKKTEEHCINISESHKGKHLQEKHPNWIKRETRICQCGCNKTFICKENCNKKYILGHNVIGKAHPFYNQNASEFFKLFDKINNTQGRYAVYGNGEYYVKGLNYWLDYINFDMSLIMEVDESHHFDKSGNLKERDIKRQKEIQEFYPNFTFRRLSEEFICFERII